MVKRAIYILIIALILFGVGTAELILVNKYMTDLDNEVAELLVEYEANEDDITLLADKAKALEINWDKKENILCLMFNHKDITVLSDCMVRLTEYTKQNNYDDAIAEIHLLKEYTEKNFTIMGFNINNIL